MKKMMIIAVIMSALLVPAQGFAQRVNVKRGEQKVQVDNQKRDNRHNQRVNNDKKINGKKYSDKKYSDNHKHRGNRMQPGHHRNPAPVIIEHRPAPVVINHRPAPRPVEVVHHHHCNNNAVEAAAVAIGVVGLISLLAN